MGIDSTPTIDGTRAMSLHELIRETLRRNEAGMRATRRPSRWAATLSRDRSLGSPRRYDRRCSRYRLRDRRQGVKDWLSRQRDACEVADGDGTLSRCPSGRILRRSSPRTYLQGVRQVGQTPHHAEARQCIEPYAIELSAIVSCAQAM